MPIEPLRCKVCGGLLDPNLKCQHCGTLHERINDKLQILKICSKHSLAYSLNCPLCTEELQAQANLEKIRREQERLDSIKLIAQAKEQEKRIEQAKAKHEQWKRINYPKLKKIGIVAVMCLIIGIAGLCLSTENYITHNVNAVPYSSNSYVPPVLASPAPTQTPTTIPSPITILSDNNVDINLVYGDKQGIAIIPTYFYQTLGTPETFTVSVFLGATVDTNHSNPLWTDGNYYDGLSNPDVISFSELNASDSYSVFICFIIPGSGAPNPLSSTIFNASFTINYIPTSTQLNILVNGTPAPPQPTPQPTGTYVTQTTTLNETYTFNQAMEIVSASAIGITEILLIVIGVLILIAVTIVVYAKSRYELE